MKHLGQHYVQRVNARLDRIGTLWQGRFYSCPVASERYVLACYRYIERNPVASGMVGGPADYRWSSFAVNAGGGSGAFIQPHAAYLGLASGCGARGSAYSELVHTPLEQPVIDEIRRATRGGYVMGAERDPRRQRK
jgi:putative transposase